MDLLASDLHLSSATPDLNAAFIALLDGRARKARRLFLLGDVFEVWAGDEDAELPEYRPVIAALRALTDAGVELHVLPGNRDFLLGAGFVGGDRCRGCTATGCCARSPVGKALLHARRHAVHRRPALPAVPPHGAQPGSGRPPSSRARWPSATPSPPTCAGKAQSGEATAGKADGDCSTRTTTRSASVLRSPRCVPADPRPHAPPGASHA
jgi:hypothetical protein